MNQRTAASPTVQHHQHRVAFPLLLVVGGGQHHPSGAVRAGPERQGGPGVFGLLRSPEVDGPVKGGVGGSQGAERDGQQGQQQAVCYWDGDESMNGPMRGELSAVVNQRRGQPRKTHRRIMGAAGFGLDGSTIEKGEVGRSGGLLVLCLFEVFDVWKVS